MVCVIAPLLVIVPVVSTPVDVTYIFVANTSPAEAVTSETSAKFEGMAFTVIEDKPS
jgi:hypothetical protein